jgi:hypothetical protein
LHGNIFPRRTTWTIVSIRQFSAAYSAVIPSRAVEDGLGEERRVLLAHSMRNGHHQLLRPGGMTRLDPVR